MKHILWILYFGVIPVGFALFLCWMDDRHEKRQKKAYNEERLYRQYDDLVKERWERKANLR